MEYQKFGTSYVVRLDKNEMVVEKLREVCEKEGIKLGSLSGFGSIDKASLGIFHTKEKIYEKIDNIEPMQIVSLIGNITTKDGKPYFHCHMSLCDKDNVMYGGHLNDCRVSSTAEFIIHSVDGVVEREFDRSLGLNVFKFVK